MKNAIYVFVGIVLIGCLSCFAQADDPFAVGEKWTYEHDGAIPMRPPDSTITGDRTREVVVIQGDGEEKRWVILEAWGDDDEWAGKRFVGADRMYDRMEGGGDRVITINPATLYDGLNLKPGEEKNLESTFEFGADWSFPMKLTAKRVKDETIKVPAGEFENCIHVQSEEAVTFTPPNGDEMTITTKRKQWFHSDVNGLVKEIFMIGLPNGGEEKGVSELKLYTKAEKE